MNQSDIQYLHFWSATTPVVAALSCHRPEWPPNCTHSLTHFLTFLKNYQQLIHKKFGMWTLSPIGQERPVRALPISPEKAGQGSAVFASLNASTVIERSE